MPDLTAPPADSDRPTSAPPEEPRADFPLKAAFVTTACLYAGGFLLSIGVAAAGLHLPGTGSPFTIFYDLYIRNEPPATIIGLLCLAVLYLFFVRARKSASERGGAPSTAEGGFPGSERAVVAGVAFMAIAVGVMSWLGTSAIFHDHPFSMDEYGVAYLAEILAEGEVFAEVAEPARPFTKAMTPVFVGHHRDPDRWVSHYLPTYAAILVLSKSLGAAGLANPLMAALSVILIALIARRLWPEKSTAPLWAAALLASSSQFLVTSMSFYTMPAHLFFSLLWLWVWLRDGRVILLLPWIGIVAMGLHQFVMHSVFAAPFLLWLVIDRRFKVAAYTCAVYLMGLAGWYYWLQMVRPALQPKVAAVFGFPRFVHWANQGMNLTMMVSWHSVALALLVILALFRFRQLPKPLRLMVLSVLTTFAFYIVYLRNQGHGWGYRYSYPIVGNLVLLAVWAGFDLEEYLGPKRARGLMLTGIVLSMLTLLPLRLAQAERAVRPFAEADSWLHSLPAEAVMIDAGAVWYGQDLVRNDPWLRERPLIIDSARMTPELVNRLREMGPVIAVPPKDLERFGLRAIGTEPERLRIKAPVEERQP